MRDAPTSAQLGSTIRAVIMALVSFNIVYLIARGHRIVIGCNGRALRKENTTGRNVSTELGHRIVIGRNGRALRKENTTFFCIQINIEYPLISNLSIYKLLLIIIDISRDCSLQYDWSCYRILWGPREFAAFSL